MYDYSYLPPCSNKAEESNVPSGEQEAHRAAYRAIVSTADIFLSIVKNYKSKAYLSCAHSGGLPDVLFWQPTCGSLGNHHWSYFHPQAPATFVRFYQFQRSQSHVLKFSYNSIYNILRLGSCYHGGHNEKQWPTTAAYTALCRQQENLWSPSTD